MIKLKIVTEIALDRKGKQIKDKEGEYMYQQNDFMGLMNLLGRFNSTLHDIKEYKSFLKIKDIVKAGWLKDEKEIELGLDESSFLKSYLSKITEKEAKGEALQEYEMRTMMGILDQLV